MTSAGTPLVSVIMPVFNGATTIADAIASAFDDDTVPLEILVADDGSDDDTEAVVAGLDDERIRMLSTGGRRLGANAGRNVAIDHARGEWIAFLDPDDTWLPGRLQTLLGAAETKGCDWIGDDILIKYLDPQGTELGESTVFTQRGLHFTGYRDLDLVDLIRYDLGVLQPMIRRRMLDEPRIRFPRPATSDFTFLFWSLDAAGRAGVVDKAMYRYNKVEGQATMSHASPAFWLDSVESTAQLLADAQDLGPEVTGALERRLQEATRKYHYLHMRRDLESGHSGRALTRGLRHPSALAVALGAAGRSVKARLQRRGGSSQ